MERLWVGFGAIAGMTMVGMAAYAAHGLQGVAPSVLTGVNSGVLAHLAGVAFLAGIVMFCGTIYQPIAPAWLRGLHVPMLAPAGGMSLIAGWAFLWLSALRR